MWWPSLQTFRSFQVKETALKMCAIVQAINIYVEKQKVFSKQMVDRDSFKQNIKAAAAQAVLLIWHAQNSHSLPYIFFLFQVHHQTVSLFLHGKLNICTCKQAKARLMEK